MLIIYFQFFENGKEKKNNLKQMILARWRNHSRYACKYAWEQVEEIYLNVNKDYH